MQDRRFEFAGDVPAAQSADLTWLELGEAIRQMAAELADQISNDPESVVAAVLLFGGPVRTIDVSRN